MIRQRGLFGNCVRALINCVIFYVCGLILVAPLLAMEASPVGFVQAQQRHCADTPIKATRPDTKTYLLDINACVQEGQYQSALSLAVAAKRRAQAEGDTKNWLTSLNAEAAVLYYLGAYSESLDRYEQVHRAWRSQQDPMVLINSENNAAALLNRLQRSSEARSLAESALVRAKALNSEIYIASVSGTLASALIGLKEYDKAQNLLETCVSVGNAVNSRLLIVGCAQVEAELYAAQGQWQASLAAAERGLADSEDKSIRSELPELYLSKATALRSLHQLDEALSTARSGLEIAEQAQRQDLARRLWQLIAELQTDRQDLAAALHAQTEVSKLNQLIFDRQLANVTAVQQVELEVAAKEAEITLLKKENEIQLIKVAAANAQRAIVIVVSLLMLAIFIGALIWWMHRRDMRRARSAHFELQRLNDLKDQFLANTSHELRTPLNGIIGLSDVMQRTEGDRMSREAIEQLSMIRDCGMQLSKLVDDILDLSRLRADKMSLKLQAVSLEHEIQQAVQLLNPLAKAKSLDLMIDLPVNLPLARADPDRLRQVLHNIIGNAIKFTDTGEIVVSVRQEAEQLIVGIRDTGIGIPADQQSSIFNVFEQVDGSSNRRHGGTGLGLSIARALVRAHGGELRVASELQHGSEFTFNLAIAKS